jgi:hypothetical protein
MAMACYHKRSDRLGVKDDIIVDIISMVFCGVALLSYGLALSLVENLNACT